MKIVCISRYTLGRGREIPCEKVRMLVEKWIVSLENLYKTPKKDQSGYGSTFI